MDESTYGGREGKGEVRAGDGESVVVDTQKETC